MAVKEEEKKQTCFIVMPLTTPEKHFSKYKEDKDHFKHVLDHLFIPAIDAAGLEPIIPISQGSDVIHVDIISNLEDADLVLVDMSILNANVFFEMGIRTALNKPTSHVVEETSEYKIPFDTSIINYHKYNPSLDAWIIEEEIPKLTKHIQDCMKKTPDYNALWRVFGLKEAGKGLDFGKNENTELELLRLEVREIKELVKKPSENDQFSKYLTQYINVPVNEDNYSRTQNLLKKRNLIGSTKNLPEAKSEIHPNRLVNRLASIINIYLDDENRDFYISFDDENNLFTVNFKKKLHPNIEKRIFNQLSNEFTDYNIKFDYRK